MTYLRASCHFVWFTFVLVCSSVEAGTKLENVQIKKSNSEYAAPPRIMVTWSSSGTQRVVADERIFIPVRVSAKIGNVSKKYEIFRAWIFVTGKSKPITNQVPDYGYTLLRNRNPVRNIGGDQTLVFFKKNLRQLEQQAIDICNAKAQANKTSYHPINIPLSFTTTAGKAGFGNHSKTVHKSDGLVVRGDVACQRKMPQVRNKTSTTGSSSEPRVKRASNVESSRITRANPKPVRTSSNPKRVKTAQPDVFIRGVIQQGPRQLSAFVHSAGASSDRCTLVAQYEQNGKAKTRDKIVGPITINSTEQVNYLFKSFSKGIPAEVKFNLHCPDDRDVYNNQHIFVADSISHEMGHNTGASPTEYSKQVLTGDSQITRQQLAAAQQTKADFDDGRLSHKDANVYKNLLVEAERRQDTALNTAVGDSAGSYQGVHPSQSCHCTALCQTIIWASNAGSIEWSVSGPVSSPSACADAAVATCGNAVASYLLGWSCR